jgi:hypothetical protein
MEAQNKKILLVEDDLNFGAVLKDYLMKFDKNVEILNIPGAGFRLVINY